MKQFKNSISILLVAIAFASCSTDIDVTADYEEATEIYGFLNPDTSTQVIRVGKVFLGSGDVSTYAKNLDSINYNPADLEVTLEYYKNGSLQQPVITMKDTTVTQNTTSGEFANVSLLYITREKIKQETGGSYKIIVHNKKTNHNASAETQVVSPLSIESPQGGIAFISSDGQYNKIGVKWTEPSNAYQFWPRFRFKYTEIDKLDTSKKAEKHVDVIIGTVIGENTISPSPSATMILTEIKKQVAPNSAVRRKIGYFEFIVPAIQQEMYNYMQVAKPTTNILQQRPIYTNIKGGVGIFSYRTGKSRNYVYTNPSLDSIEGSSFTRNLGFVR